MVQNGPTIACGTVVLASRPTLIVPKLVMQMRNAQHTTGGQYQQQLIVVFSKMETSEMGDRVGCAWSRR